MFLEELVKKISKKHSEQDTKIFYIIAQRCCVEIIELLEDNLVEKDEKEKLQQAREIWYGDYNKDVLNILLSNFPGRKRIRGSSEERRNFIRAALIVLTSYEKYSPEYSFERSNTLEYFIFHIQKAGIKESQIIPILIKHFLDYLSF